MPTSPKAKTRPARTRKPVEDKPAFLADAETQLTKEEQEAGHPSSKVYEMLMKPLLDVIGRIASAHGMALYCRVEPLPGGGATAYSQTIMPTEGSVSLVQAFIAHAGNSGVTIDECIRGFINAYGHLNSPALIAAQIALGPSPSAPTEEAAG